MRTQTHPRCCCSPCLTETQAGCESSRWRSPYSDCCHQRSCSAGELQAFGLLVSFAVTLCKITFKDLHQRCEFALELTLSLLRTSVLCQRSRSGSGTEREEWCLDSINFGYVHCLVRPVFEMRHYMMCSLQQPHHLLLPVLSTVNSPLEPAGTAGRACATSAAGACCRLCPSAASVCKPGQWRRKQGWGSISTSLFLPTCKNIWK